MLETKDIVNKLENLMKLDVDAVRAYDDAIKNIDVDDVKNQLMNFKGDHERHITDLSACIRKLGATPPPATPDVKGFFIEGMTKIQSALGTHGALTAMRTNEKLTNKKYDGAMNWDVPDDIKAVIRKNYDDEQRHLNYIEQCIEDKVWEMSERKTA